MEGIIIRGRGGLYTVRDGAGREYVLRAKKKFRRQKISPLVGDQIVFTPGDISDEHGWVEEIMPRKSLCFRPPVANVTLLCIVISPQPEPDFMLVDKLLVYAKYQDLSVAVIVNKCDMDASVLEEETRKQYRGAEVDIFGVSAKDGRGMEALKKRLENEAACFSGQSGVGKSTLLNALFSLQLDTGNISEKIARGKNTTRHAELFTFGTTQVFDTPGFSLLEFEDTFDPVLLQDEYPEFEKYLGQCRFNPCYHDSEPGCAVKNAAAAGEIASERYERYRQFLEKYRQNWSKRYD